MTDNGSLTIVNPATGEHIEEIRYRAPDMAKDRKKVERHVGEALEKGATGQNRSKPSEQRACLTGSTANSGLMPHQTNVALGSGNQSEKTIQSRQERSSHGNL